jgi:hypothetical protein
MTHRLALIAILAIGCEPAVLALPQASAHADAADSTDGSDGQDGGVPANCEAPQQTQDTGHHNPGLDCGACHNGQMQAAGAPIWTLAGTLYHSGATPMVGATIRVHTANGQTLKLTTAQNGNFYTSMAIRFPITVEASSCPDTQGMTDPVQGPSVSCNSCHVTGGGAGAPIHLP